MKEKKEIQIPSSCYLGSFTSTSYLLSFFSLIFTSACLSHLVHSLRSSEWSQKPILSSASQVGTPSPPWTSRILIFDFFFLWLCWLFFTILKHRHCPLWPYFSFRSVSSRRLQKYAPQGMHRVWETWNIWCIQLQRPQRDGRGLRNH